MTLFQQLLIAIVQGITEFLPISSSGHLILIPYLTDLPDQGPLIDVAVHVGSLLAIIIYFGGQGVLSETMTIGVLGAAAAVSVASPPRVI